MTQGKLAAEEECTEVKLAVLASLFEDFDSEILLDALLRHDGDVAKTTTSLVNHKRIKAPTQKDEPSWKRLRWNTAASQELKRKKETVLELHDPERLEIILPCALIRNVLPVSLANDLLKEMLQESTSWTKGYFKLFNRTVSSPHTASFYLKTQADIAKHKTYVYNGQSLENIKPFTPSMTTAHKLVDQATRMWLQKRNFDHHYKDHDWSSNVAFSNLYDGRESAVGYHSDQLTYLGPLPTIASLSLGCEREFRLKPTSSGRTISVRLPHNSLFIMGPGCQEDYKHAIHPVAGTKGLDMHPIAGARRINITYRKYRDDYNPEALPRCKCGQMVLRSAKAGVKTHDPSETWHGRRYFWHCDGDKAPGAEGCGDFHWAKFNDQGGAAG